MTVDHRRKALRRVAAATGAGGWATMVAAAFALIVLVALAIGVVEFARRSPGGGVGAGGSAVHDVAGARPEVVGPAPAGPRTVGGSSGALPPRPHRDEDRGSAGRVDAPRPAEGPLEVPVDGVDRDDLEPSFDEPRGTRPHEAIDILAPRGTPVRAAADGRVVKLFTSAAGGLTVYQFDRDERLAYYYAHLDRYADGLREGVVLRRGDLVGYVGSTGNADEGTPHLHFAVFELGPEKRWWDGRPIDPFPLLTRP